MQIQHPGKWSTPPSGYLKCNVDAAIFCEQKAIGVGMIMRNEAAQVVGCHMRRINGFGSSTKAEAIGIREVVLWLEDKRVTQAIVEADAKAVVDALHSSMEDIS